MRELTIGGRRIADDEPCFVIAEIGNNHQGSVQTAQALIRMASAAGASAVKLQVRSNHTLYSRALLDQPYVNENSFGPTYGAHRAALELNLNALAVTQATATECGAQWFATAFDERSADRLMALQVPAIKLASGAVTDTPLQRHVARLGVPVILSTGGSTDQEIDRAIETLSAGSGGVALLHCTAAYPLAPAEANLRCLETLRTRYPETVIGYSSHATALWVPLVAVALGARIIEVHVTLNRAAKGTDHAFSLEPRGLATLCEDVRQVPLALGDGVKRVYASERGPIAKMRRVQTEDGWQITGAR